MELQMFLYILLSDFHLEPIQERDILSTLLSKSSDSAFRFVEWNGWNSTQVCYQSSKPTEGPEGTSLNQISVVFTNALIYLFNAFGKNSRD